MRGRDVRRARRSRRYRRWRRGILAREPLCRSCAARGYTVAAAELDHIVPVERAPGRFFDESNVQPLCRACHEAKTLAEARAPETPDQAAWRERVEGYGR
ncbi:HNH endonuclease signature motif containing protein [Candidatus Palauibacter sp.]|uniref:HNH endonuclease signature motif containing protein n=1 Tax=Candidatus Palauibacter sp. TaxID=3101350 RepID=UPI003CC50491